MKLFQLVCTGAFVVGVSTHAMAQSALDLGSTISPTCTAFSLTTNTVNLGTISDPSSPGALNAAAVNIALSGTTPSITCNGGGTTLSIDANPLTGPALPSGAATFFSNTVNYTATINKAGGSDFVQTLAPTGISNASSSPSATSSTVGLVAGNFSIALSGAATGAPLIAGGYTGTVTIALTPG
jgi:hypothetical protein